MKRIKIYILINFLILTCLAHSVYADDEILSGDINFDFSYFKKNPENDNFSTNSPEIDFRPKLEKKFSSKFHTYFEGKLRHNFSKEYRNRYILNEGYIDFYPPEADKLDIRLGQQIISWGRADYFKPTDQFKIYDYTDLAKLDEEGISALKLDCFLPSFDLEGVFVPYFVKHNINFSEENRWNPLAYQQFGGFKVKFEEDNSFEPVKNLSSSQFGFRINHQGENLDYGFSYSAVYDRVPTSLGLVPKSIDFSTSEAVYIVQPKYYRQQVVGLDFASVFFEYALRGEMAYTFTKDKKGEKSDIDDSYFQLVTGIERTFNRIIGDFNLFILTQYALDKEFPERGLENQVEHSFKHFFRQMLLLNSEFKKDETKKLILKGMFNLEKKDYIFQPEFKIIPPTSGRISKEIYIHTDILSGRDGTFFGAFNKNDRVEAGIKIYY